jgi:hypothetical protein
MLAACSTGPRHEGQPPRGSTAGASPCSSEDLRPLLLSKDAAPSDMVFATGGSVDDRKDYQTAGAASDCTNLINMSSFIFSPTATQPIGNATESFSQKDDPHWFGTERLLSYASGGATHVMKDLQNLAEHCSQTQDDDFTYEVNTEAGAAIGDECLKRVLIETPKDGTNELREADTLIIRDGDNLIIIEGLDQPKGTATPIDVIAADAYQAAHSH